VCELTNAFPNFFCLELIHMCQHIILESKIIMTLNFSNIFLLGILSLKH